MMHGKTHYLPWHPLWGDGCDAKKGTIDDAWRDTCISRGTHCQGMDSMHRRAPSTMRGETRVIVVARILGDG